jgi:hypothetical protein
MKHLFFIAPKVEKGDEVTEVFLAEKQARMLALGASDAGVSVW